jgi:hypothetical protein
MSGNTIYGQDFFTCIQAIKVFGSWTTKTGGISSGIAIKLFLFTFSPRKPLETRVVRKVLVDRTREIRKKLVEEVLEKMGEMGEERCQSKRTAIERVRSPRQGIQGNVSQLKCDLENVQLLSY